jgi:uncharacterized protein
MNVFDQETTTALEAAAFRRLLNHLAKRSDVQNIDMMNLTGFCRNCLSNWIMDAAQERDLVLTKDQARQHVYGMSYDTWREQHQLDATEAQKQAFAVSAKNHG